MTSYFSFIIDSAANKRGDASSLSARFLVAADADAFTHCRFTLSAIDAASEY